MALTGYDHLIPLNEVVGAMDQVAKNSPRIALRSSRGGFPLPRLLKRSQSDSAAVDPDAVAHFWPKINHRPKFPCKGLVWEVSGIRPAFGLSSLRNRQQETMVQKFR